MLCFCIFQVFVTNTYVGDDVYTRPLTMMSTHSDTSGP